MPGIIESILGKLGGSVISLGLRAAVVRFRPRRIARAAAPRNFFDHFGPGVSNGFVSKTIGDPHRVYGSTWLYQFSDALAQFDFDESGAANSVILALSESSPKAGFAIPMISSVPLGKLTFDDICAEDGSFRFRSSLRTWELLFEGKFPPHWVSHHITLGALSAQAPGSLRESYFDNRLARHSPRFASKGVLVNWVGVSATSEELWFDYGIALPISM